MFKGKKTYLAGVGALLIALGSFFTGEMAAVEAMQLAFTALIGIFLRQGIANA